MSDIATHLQDLGYFTRFCRVNNEEWMEVCKPNEDVTVEDVTRDLKGMDLEVIQIAGPDDRCWNHYVRVSERQP